LALVLASCSSDDSATPTTEEILVDDQVNLVLVKKIIETTPDNEIIKSLLTYNENRLVKSVSDDDTSEKFTYTGDLITKIEYFEGAVVTQTDTYAYNADGKLATHIRSEPSEPESRETYVYNADGTITATMSSGGVVSATAKIIFENGEVKRIERGAVITHSFTYDNRNNPTKEVLGLDKISYSANGSDGILHNVVKDEMPGNLFVVSFEYNGSNYPTKATETYNTDVTKYQYFYE